MILKAYPYIPNDVRYSAKLLSELNATVAESALQSKESVSTGFLIHYLNSFFLINRQSDLRDMTKEQRATMTSILEEKIAAQGATFAFPP